MKRDFKEARHRVIRRVIQQFNGADNTRYFLIEAASVTRAWEKAIRASDPIGRAGCDSCHHLYCSICKDFSLSQNWSGYWFCHTCGALNPRFPNSRLREVSNGLGQN